MPKTIFYVLDESDFHQELGSLIEKLANSAISSHGSFSVGVSGGSLVQMLQKCLPTLNTDWGKWTIFFCDERIVSFEDPDSTYGLYKKSLSGKIPIKDEQYITISPQLSAPEAAIDYENKLKLHFGSSEIPKFDLLLLGVGPDGHTCSLFPGHPLLSEESAWVAPITDSPKPPPSRVTLTFPVINNSRNCLFPISGKGKASILRRLLPNRENLPVNHVKLHSGDTYWVLDRVAASEILS